MNPYLITLALILHIKYSILLLLLLTSQIQTANWPLDDINDTLIMRGNATPATGASGQSLVLDGESLVELKDSSDLASDSFTVSLWFNPYDLAGGQQMLAVKNRYSRNVASTTPIRRSLTKDEGTNKKRTEYNPNSRLFITYH
ncbi:MAG: hypothetical protein NTW52_01030 [Planctomycetota bacterium]|nr:hypothetical protein [Planctomycetota bacterium]